MEAYQRVSQSEKAAAATALIGKAQERFGGIFKLLFFTCACGVIASGIISIITAATSFAPPFDFINYVFLTIFGLLMFFIDLPYETPLLRGFRYAMFTYALFMTRFVGRGVWYLFLASMTVGALWDNNVLPFLGFILGAYIAAVAGYSIFYGWRLSKSLEGVRVKILEQGPEQWGAYIPPDGLSKVQFRDLAASLNGVTFTDEQLGYIVAAMSFDVRSDDIISREEFEEWVRGPSMIVL
ncbi:unnamed protein product [Amoebophrya sp. A25]|nr:unnamed protein product [Amoebophrya sp. A25]|eukprot:GSA25T00004315001.1